MRHVVGTFYNGAERRQVQKQHDRFRHRTQKAQHPAYLCHHSIIRYRAKQLYGDYHRNGFHANAEHVFI